MLISSVIRIIFLIVVIMLSGCSPETPPATLKIGYTHEPPYSYVNEVGEVRGVYPDVARQITRKMGVDNVKWVLLSFDRLIPALLNKRIDVIAAGMAVTRARTEQNLCFTTPLSQSNTAVLWRKDNNNVISEAPLSSQALRFVVIDGSSEESILKQHYEPEALLSVEDIRLGLLALKSGRADMLVMTRPTLMQVSEETPERYQIKDGQGILENRQVSAFVIKKQDTELAQRWNTAQASVSKQEDTLSALTQGGMTPFDASLHKERCYTL